MSKTKIIILSVTLAVVGVGVGVIIGYFSHPSAKNDFSQPEEDASIQSKLMNEMKSENIRQYLG